MNESLLVKHIIFNSIVSLILIYGTISYIIGVNPFNNKKIVTNNIFSRILVKVIIPLVFLCGSFWFAGEPILDYTLKDYQNKTGLIKYINSTKSGVEMKIVGDKETFYFPSILSNNVKKGEYYKFYYGKRSKFVIGISKQ